MTDLAGRAPRVLYFTDTYPPQVNGVSVVTALSVRGLIERGWECVVVAPKYEESTADAASRKETVTSIPSMAMPLYPELRLAAPAFRAVDRAVREFQPDIVHCATEFMLGGLGHRAARRAGIPVVSSYHTDFGRYAAAYGVPWLRGSVTKYIARFHQRSARTFTPSAPARSDLLGMGVKHVEVSGRGVDIARFHPRQRNPITRAGYAAASDFLFLHVGRLAAEKGVHRIIEAFKIARQLSPSVNMRCVIAGSGPEERALHAMGVPGITFLGVLDRDRALPQLYASADAFLFTSLTETLGLVVLEAMSSGLPVIATPAGGVADHLRHGENGLAVPANDPQAMATAMIALATDPSLRLNLAAGARRTAEALSWDAELDRLDASYREVIRQAAVPLPPRPARDSLVRRTSSLQNRNAGVTIPATQQAFDARSLDAPRRTIL